MKELNKYNKKRNFNETSEPVGLNIKEEMPKPKLKFVIQHHIASHAHYDFRLEHKGVLLSWAVPKGLSANPQDKRLAIQVEDHPYSYKDFEGTIPKGLYGGGTVMLWDEGFWQPESDVDIDDVLSNGELKFNLLGKRLMGSWVLIKMKEKDKKKASQKNWLLIKQKDEYATSENILSQFTTSVRTGRTMDEISKKE